MESRNDTTTKGETMITLELHARGEMGDVFTLTHATWPSMTVEIIIRPATCYLPAVSVIVRNASSRAWNPQFSAGKSFESIDAAVANYKTQSIKDMILYAADAWLISSPVRI